MAGESNIIESHKIDRRTSVSMCLIVEKVEEVKGTL